MTTAQPFGTTSANGGARRFTRHEYHRMAEAGILTRTDRVELLEGTVVMMSPIGRRHLAVVDYLNGFFAPRLSGQAIVRVQGAVCIGEHSEPEPDLQLLRRRDDHYASIDATPEDVLLLVEVADTSLDIDLGRKLELYADGGVREYWVLDLTRDVLIVHREPAARRYEKTRHVAAGESIAPEAFPDCTLDVGAALLLD